MPQLFKVIDEPEPTMETPSALNRLQSMLGPNALSVVEDAPAVDADIDDAGGVPDDESVTSGDETVAPSPTAEEGADDMSRVAASEPPESSAVVPSDAATGEQTRPDTVAVFQATVRQAQQKVETQLLAVVEQVRNETSERHAADLARVVDEANHRAEIAVLGARTAAEADWERLREEIDQRHAQALRHAQDNVRAEMTAAAERHAAELVCLRDELEQQHAEELQRVCAVALDSFEVLTDRIVQTA